MKFLITLVVLLPLSLSAQEMDFLTMQSTQIEALESQDGTYARFADIAEGFVKFKGVQAVDNNIIINLDNNDLSSVFLQNGTNPNFNQVIHDHATISRGGDMGGGGAAFILQ